MENDIVLIVAIHVYENISQVTVDVSLQKHMINIHGIEVDLINKEIALEFPYSELIGWAGANPRSISFTSFEDKDHVLNEIKKELLTKKWLMDLLRGE